MENTPLLGSTTDQQQQQQGQEALVEQQRRRTRRIQWFTSRAVFLCVFLFVVGVATRLAQRIDNVELRVDVAAVVANLKTLEEIGRHSRSVAGTGFAQSVAFVKETLENNTDFAVWTEALVVEEQVDDEKPSLVVGNTAFTPRIDFLTATYSGSGVVKNATLVPLAGCRSSDAPQLENWVALVSSQPSRQETTPDCDNSLCARVAFAIEAGAKAVLVSVNPTAQGYPNPLAPSGRLPRTCNTPSNRAIYSKAPILSLSQSLSWSLHLQSIDSPSVSLSATTSYKPITVHNVLAEPRAGFSKPESIVIFGCHLDSVRAGPGVNDDGSGAMATLELALAYSRDRTITIQRKPNPPLHYKANIDTDMIASPNYVRGIWDGRSVTDPAIRNASIAIQRVFEDYFHDQELPTVPFKFNGRSDFAPFMARGIPAGGVITGEDEIKTHEQAELFGGVAGMVLDPNYHQPTDTVENCVDLV
ncbi:Zn-dependent exopeptidase [Rhizoclosmatium globosum]|uniref:Peptide hydrolase n=1 Tax=Rhizoclosmatium globosum TaxID=329046 RepID=A0A1Y2BX17_9FUNG|nr:Zn-dependent exopeptidase [Rhizoclosmatium globosum]|eukprot:ORY39309.1 Zn-dependent exopeptidase [Rhizoclosmatium globosum]